MSAWNTFAPWIFDLLAFAAAGHLGQKGTAWLGRRYPNSPLLRGFGRHLIDAATFVVPMTVAEHAKPLLFGGEDSTETPQQLAANLAAYQPPQPSIVDRVVSDYLRSALGAR